MRPRGIDLILVEEDNVVRKAIIEVTHKNISKGKYFYKPDQPLQHNKKIKTEGGEFVIKELAVNYVKSQHKVHNVFRKILAGDQDQKKRYPFLVDSYLHLAAVPFAYVTKDAYELIRHTYPKEKETDAEIIAAAHYDEKKGIFVSLNIDESLGRIIVHEYGHYLHHTLTPEKYKEASSTMKEVMAIFIEYNCGHHSNYPAYLPHYRAEQLLQKLKKTKTYGKDMNVSDQWNFLNASDYETLEEFARTLK